MIDVDKSIQGMEHLREPGNEMATALDRLLTQFNQTGGLPDVTMLIMPADKALADWNNVIAETKR